MTDQATNLTFAPKGDGHAVALDRLVEGGLLIQGNSGAGKSEAIRVLLEQTFGLVQHVVFDTEGEFSTLRERYDYLLVARTDGDTPASVGTAAQLCRRVMEFGVSVLVDLYDLDLDARQEYVRAWLTELMELPRDLWRPTLVIVDEAHRYAPQGAGAAAKRALANLAAQGRKRGYRAVLATQRLSKLDKDVAAEISNRLFGRTTLRLDVESVADELGLPRADQGLLKALKPGEFYGVGPAICPEPVLLRVPRAATRPPKAGSTAPPPPAPAAIRALLERFADLPEAEAQEAAGDADLRRRLQDAERTIAELRADLSRASASVAQERERRLAMKEGVVTALQRLIDDRHHDLPEVPSSPTRAPVVEPPAALPGDGDLPRAQQRILDALARFEAVGVRTLDRAIVAAQSQQSPRSSAYETHLRALRDGGLVDLARAGVSLTAAGRRQARASAAPPTLAELHQSWERLLPDGQVRILRAVVRSHPAPLTLDTLATAASMSRTSSAFEAHVRALRKLGLVGQERGGPVRATALLFPPSLL